MVKSYNNILRQKYPITDLSTVLKNAMGYTIGYRFVIAALPTRSPVRLSATPYPTRHATELTKSYVVGG